MKKSRIIVIVLAIAAAITFHQYFWIDYAAYSKAKETRSKEDCVAYLARFPYEGFYVEEVKLINIEERRNIYDIKQFLSWHSRSEYYDKVNKIREEVLFEDLQKEPEISKVKHFLKIMPNSEYKDQVLAIKDQLWDAEIDKYEKMVQGQKANPEAVEFFRSLLKLMKKKNTYEIGVEFESKLDLKDYNDYPENLRAQLENGVNPSIPKNIIPLKSNFSRGDITILEDFVKNGLKNSLDSVFSKGFVDISSKKDVDLKIKIGYEIKNQTFTKGGSVYPEIWTYTVKNEFSSYLLGIAVDFDFSFALPEGGQTFAFTKRSDPSGTISNIQDVQDAYRRMTRVTFMLFSNNVSSKFGLGAGYR